MIRMHTRMAANSLRSNKVRTALTLLGIIIGVTSVTTIIGLGEGVKKQVNDQINDLGTDLVTIVPGHDSSVSGFDGISASFGASGFSTSRLSEKDFETVSNTPEVDEASAVMQLDGSIRREDNKQNARILGTNQNYLDVTNQKLQSGQFFGGSLANNYTVVLSSIIASSLFGSEDPLGSTVKIRDTNFVVIGILDSKEGFNFGQPVNNTVIIPLDTAKKFNQNIVQIQQINFRLEDSADTEKTIAQIQKQLEANRNGEADFTITTQQQLVETTDSVFRVLTGFTAAVASISLLVGGIGVMNIMLVTVTERTKEIGIRKAVGATKVQILMQFLVESIVITLTGGLIGILCSLILGYLINSQTSIRSTIDLRVLLLATIVSLTVGVIFGTWPAIRAAQKDPTSSLKNG